MIQIPTLVNAEREEWTRERGPNMYLFAESRWTIQIRLRSFLRVNSRLCCIEPPDPSHWRSQYTRGDSHVHSWTAQQVPLFRILKLEG